MVGNTMEILGEIDLQTASPLPISVQFPSEVVQHGALSLCNGASVFTTIGHIKPNEEECKCIVNRMPWLAAIHAQKCSRVIRSGGVGSQQDMRSGLWGMRKGGEGSIRQWWAGTRQSPSELTRRA